MITGVPLLVTAELVMLRHPRLNHNSATGVLHRPRYKALRVCASLRVGTITSSSMADLEMSS